MKRLITNIDLLLKFYPLWDKFNAYCYGNEEPILQALKQAFETFKVNEGATDYCKYSYSYKDIIEAFDNEMLGWTVITLLNHADFLDWGTSISCGWTTDNGTDFVDIILNNNIADLYDLIHTDHDDHWELGYEYDCDKFKFIKIEEL